MKPATCVGGSSKNNTKNCALTTFIFQSIKVGVAFCMSLCTDYMELNNFSVRLSFSARKLLLLFFLRIKTGPCSLEGATLSLCKYASELAGYGVNSVIARSISLFLYILQGKYRDETFVRRHMTT